MWRPLSQPKQHSFRAAHGPLSTSHHNPSQPRSLLSRGSKPRTRLSCRVSAEAPNIRLVCVDIDGTLLNSNSELSAATEAAVAACSEKGVPVLVATGKAPGGSWMQKLIPRLCPPQPGVFMQGLVIFGPDGVKSTPIYNRCLDPDLAAKIIQVGAQHGLTVMAYCTGRILTAATDKHTDRMLTYGEPDPEAVGDLVQQATELGVQKFIYGQDPEVIKAVRPRILEALGGEVSLTSALPGLLEVLPPGASKGAGVAQLLKLVDVPPEHVMALGDGENDLEMMQTVGWPVVMANAVPQVKAVCKAETLSNDEDGVAAALQRYVLEA